MRLEPQAILLVDFGITLVANKRPTRSELPCRADRSPNTRVLEYFGKYRRGQARVSRGYCQLTARESNNLR
jgi:hypothetical protein